MQNKYRVFLDGKKHCISLVGAGGKTTVMYELAEFFAQHGQKTLVATTTHIYQPEKNYCLDEQQVSALWRQGKYAVIGQKSGNKLIMDEQLFAELKEQADIILVEADGAKGMPCKVPRAHEPVILPECDIVLGVMGMDAAGCRLKDCCFAPEQVMQLLQAEREHVLRAEDMAKMLLSEEGTRKFTEGRGYYIILNKCDNPVTLAAAQELRMLVGTGSVKPSGILLRGELADE